jgi:hypothetical protein
MLGQDSIVTPIKYNNSTPHLPTRLFIKKKGNKNYTIPDIELF